MRTLRSVAAAALPMTALAGAALVLFFTNSLAAETSSQPPAERPPGLCRAAADHVGRPYVWGTAGLKTFDCSGYVWRTLFDNRILIKRTTARKLYFSLPAVADSGRYEPDTIVFFDHLKHCGIVHDDSTFYQAQLSRGTNLSRFDPYWRRKICGFRRIRMK